MKCFILNNIKRKSTSSSANNIIFKTVSYTQPSIKYSNKIIRNFSSANNNNNNNKIKENSNNKENDENLMVPPRSKLSKELESLGAYLPNEEYTEEIEFDDDDNYNEEEYYEEDDNNNNNKNNEIINVEKERNVKEKEEKQEEEEEEQQRQHLQEEERIKRGKKFQDMIYRIKENHELSNKHSVDLLNGVDEFDSFEEIERKVEEKLKLKYQEKMKTLDSMDEADFIYKDKEKVDLYNKISENFIKADTHFETPFETTDRQLENNQLLKPMGLSSMIANDSPFNKVSQNDDISSRISKIKQRIQKDKLTNHRINGENLVNLFSLYREDPILNNPQSLAKKFNLSEKSVENLLKYATIPIIVKFNTGIKSGHWNVIYET
ncbi:hypothetical protein ACTA71_004401 [Dictyostelium dimigraforme]